jgi:hypothetical protein
MPVSWIMSISMRPVVSRSSRLSAELRLVVVEDARSRLPDPEISGRRLGRPFSEEAEATADIYELLADNAPLAKVSR